ncbi:MAG: hypothetical protein A2298_02470 [Gammaproteobacteria bacterium RIFOXYB2_FULL_38_6]|nr:MAG: hypothetical protein A2298_02470 [Gammaproteobacteria bacterium RIFOXYB2_FULL_38_6]
MWNPFKTKEISKEFCAFCSCDYGIILAHLVSDPQANTLLKARLEHAQLLPNIALKKSSSKISSVISDWGLSKSNCICVLPPADYRLLLLEAPNVPQNELKQAVRWLIKDLIDFPLKQAAIDVFSAPVRAGQSPKIYVAVTKLDYVRDLLDVIESAHLKLACIDIADLTLVRLFSFFPESASGIAYLMLDSNVARLLIQKNGILYLERNLNANPLNGSYHSPEQYESLVLEIQRSFEFYQSQFSQVLPAKLFLSPNLNEQENLKTALITSFNEMSVNTTVLDINQLFIINENSLEHPDFYLMTMGALLDQTV